MIPRGMFVNREEELKLLHEVFSSGKAELVLLYGRRRVGKTRLLLEALKDFENSIYLLADLSESILDIFAKEISRKYGFIRFANWEEFFEFLYSRASREPFIVVIDEFQYLYKVYKPWVTVLQRWWERLKETSIKLVLCGSIISAIYKVGIGYGSALYGRKTYEIEVKPLRFLDARKFFPSYSMEDAVRVYAVLGGIPRYLEEFDPERSVLENIETKILKPGAFLYNEPYNLLLEEFKDVHRYFAILLAVAQGYTKFNEISSYSRISPNKLPKYLGTLERVGVLERKTPVTATKVKTRTTRYKIRDCFYDFYFKFVYPNRSAIEYGAYTLNPEELEQHVAKVFQQEVAVEAIVELSMRRQLPLKVSRIGGWWHRGEEIDVVALDEQSSRMLLCEVKWGTLKKREVHRLLRELASKAEAVDWRKERRKVHCMVFARRLEEKAELRKELPVNTSAFDLLDLEKLS